MLVSAILTTDPVQVSPACTLLHAMNLMEEHDLRHLPVVQEGRVAGVLSDRDLLAATGGLFPGQDPAPEEPEKVGDYMRSPAATTGPDTHVFEAAREMLKRSVGCLLVVREEQLIGIVTEIDVLDAYRHAVRRDVVPRDADPLLVNLATQRPLTVAPTDAAASAHELVREHGFHHVPVVDDGKLVGMLSDRDLRRAAGRGELDALAVGECMTSRPLMASPTTPLSTAAALLVDARVSSLPVAKKDEIEAIFTVRDALEPCARLLERFSLRS